MSVVNTRKVRKIGNSKVVTIPEEVLKTLNINEGQKVAFNVERGQVVLEAVTTDGEDIMDILSIADQVSNQYDSALKDLVNR
ncbi:AbrB/MazE/SpoVT family DNA-binding domain-containing protein [Staphylococcus gallinarum]|uniref:AbrB/MazE/SpoVT family DNA-binding domain-containing protein n=1 Tax=Staphylococcus gallinarum TaxID=1293 RepID=UPI00317AF729